MEKVESIVLSYPKVLERLEKHPKDKEKILKNLKAMKANINWTTVHMVTKLLDHTMLRLYDGINLYDDGLDMPELIKKCNVVLVPNHQSHADYLAINYIFYKKYAHPIYVAGGDNLNIFPIGEIFRRCGCFFIKRTFGSDIVYKLTLEAYLYYLLMEGSPIKFYFEGGRSRNGKLRSPRFGMYTMFLEAHSHLPENKKKELVFIPTSIGHEYVPEQKSMAAEMAGAKKSKESTAQLFKVIKFLAYQFGSIHIRLGRPLWAKDFKGLEDTKKQAQMLAFDCFREVGRNMIINPTALICLILLDTPSGSMKWDELLERAKSIVEFCLRYQMPVSPSLQGDKLQKNLERAIDILVSNQKIDVIGRRSQGNLFYSIPLGLRGELLYFKNSILHHFIIPWIINNTWINLMNGTIKNAFDYKRYLQEQRELLKQEFYLPRFKDMFGPAFKMISDALKREVMVGDDPLALTKEDMFKLGSYVGVFSQSMNYLFESYYICALSIKGVISQRKSHYFTFDQLIEEATIVHGEQLRLNKLVRYPESLNRQTFANALDYLAHAKVISRDQKKYRVDSAIMLDHFEQKYAKELSSHLSVMLRSAPLHNE